MKKKAVVYTPDRGTDGFAYQKGKDMVKDIVVQDGYLYIVRDDYTTSVYVNMPFEYHEIPEEVKTNA